MLSTLRPCSLPRRTRPTDGGNLEIDPGVGFVCSSSDVRKIAEEVAHGIPPVNPSEALYHVLASGGLCFEEWSKLSQPRAQHLSAQMPDACTYCGVCLSL